LIPIGTMVPSSELVGCCGAYCKTCPPFLEGQCAGCKIGYKEGKRDLGKAKCKIKLCCIKKGFQSCADCGEFPCSINSEFYGKNGHKYLRYKASLEFIRGHGYDEFAERAKDWKRAYGKL